MSPTIASSEISHCTKQACRTALREAYLTTDLFRQKWLEMVCELDQAQQSRTPVGPTSIGCLRLTECQTADQEKDALKQERDAAVSKAEKAIRNADDLSTKLANVTKEKSILEDEKASIREQLAKCREQALNDKYTTIRMTKEVEHEMEAHEAASAEIDKLNYILRLLEHYRYEDALDSVLHYYRLRLEPALYSDSGSGEDGSSDEDEDNGTAPIEPTPTEQPNPTVAENTGANMGSPSVPSMETLES